MANPLQVIRDKISQMNRRQRLAIAFWALSAAGILLIILVAVQVWLPNRFIAYDNSRWGVSLKYPAGWRKIENNAAVAAAFLSPKEGALDVFQENVTVIVHDLSAKPMSLKVYTDTAVKQVQAVFKDGISVIESAPTFCAGETAHKFVYEGRDKNNPDLNLKAMHVWFIKDNRAYQFNYIALEKKFDKYLAAVEKMMSSLKVK